MQLGYLIRSPQGVDAALGMQREAARTWLLVALADTQTVPLQGDAT